jgi:hypothetical protein
MVLMSADGRDCYFDGSSKGLLHRALVLLKAHWLDCDHLSALTLQLVERRILVAGARNFDICLLLRRGADIESFFSDSILHYQNCNDLWGCIQHAIEIR